MPVEHDMTRPSWMDAPKPATPPGHYHIALNELIRAEQHLIPILIKYLSLHLDNDSRSREVQRVTSALQIARTAGMPKPGTPPAPVPSSELR